MTQLLIHPNIDLEYLCTIIANMAGVPIRIYTNKKQTFYHSYVHLPKDPIFLCEDKLLKITEPIGYYITSDFDYYGISNHGNQSIIIGPARQSTPSEQYLHKLAFDLSVSPEDMQEFLSAMKVIIHIPLESILQILCTLHYVITEEKIGLNDLSIIDSIQEDLSKEILRTQATQTLEKEHINFGSTQNTYKIEQQLLDLVQNGNSHRLQEWLKTIPAITPYGNASDMLHQMRNTFVATTTLVSRAAIRGGMDLEDAFLLSDSYIQKCECLNTLEQITNLQYHMVLQYAQAVENLHSNGIQSELVKKVTAYIRHHLSDAIKTEDIATSLFMSRSHLSTRFKNETGKNLSEYIHYIKISEAKHLLVHTDKNLSLISTYLGYSSQSHFTRMFKKIVGVSPMEYREKRE